MPLVNGLGNCIMEEVAVGVTSVGGRIACSAPDKHASRAGPE